MNNTGLLKCPLATCSYTVVGRGMGGHISGHKRKGELPRDSKVRGIPVGSGIDTPAPSPDNGPTPTPDMSPAQVADSLLQQVVSIVNSGDMLQVQLKSAVARVKTLEADVDRLGQEKERILKIHNDQVERKDFTTSDELVRLAKLPARRG